MELWNLAAWISASMGLFLILNFLFPFINPLWIKPSRAIWGFWVGRRRRSALFALYGQLARQKDQPNLNQPDPDAALKRFTTALQSELKGEMTRLETIHNAKEDQMNMALKNVQDSLLRINTRALNRTINAKSHFFGRILSTLDMTFTKSTGRDFLLFVATWVVVLIDALIALDLIDSLGLFPRELELFGVRLPKGYPLILGSFITISVAFALHIVLGPGMINRIVPTDRSRKLVASLLIAVFAGLLVAMVLFPSSAKPLFEIVLRFSWMLGVIVVYWLVGQIVGESHDYFRLLVAISMFIIPVLYLFFGAAFVIELLIGFAWDGLSSLLKRLYQMRLSKQIRNLNTESVNYSKGLWRGATF